MYGYAFFLCISDFFRVCGHVLLGPSVDDLDILCTQTERHPGAVHRGIPSADDHDPVPRFFPPAKCHPPEQTLPVHHATLHVVLARKSKTEKSLGACCNEYGFELPSKFIERWSITDPSAQMNPHTKGFNGGDFYSENITW
jgi:hypothetical protein